MMAEGPTGALMPFVVVAVVLAATLSVAEAAVLRLGRAALGELESSSLPSARRAVRLVADSQMAASSAALVRGVFESVAAVGVTMVIASTGVGWWQTVLLAAVLVASTALFGIRLIPSRLGQRHPVGSLMLTSGVLTAACWVLSPVRGMFVRLSDQVDLSDHELRQIVDRVSESENMADDEREMFRSVLELGETITRAVMVPRTDMITLPSGTSLRQAMALFLRSGYSRVPVVGESVDDVIGVLYLKDVVRRRYTSADSDNEPVDAVVRRPAFVPESKPVDDLLREMQQGSSHMAMVVDEFGGIAGLVTIEDALEEIVGELTDEHDHTGPEVEDLGDGSFRVPSRMPVDDLGELFDIELDDDDVDTAGGLLAKLLGKVPLVGSSAHVAGLRLTADRVEGRRKQVATLVVRREQPFPDPSTTSRSTSPNQGANHR